MQISMNRHGDRNEKCMDLGSEIYRNNYVNIDGNAEILETMQVYSPSLNGLVADLNVLQTRSVEPWRYQLIRRVLPTGLVH